MRAAEAFMNTTSVAGPSVRRRDTDQVKENELVAKEELLEIEGTVTDVLPDARFRVELENGHEIIAYTAGRMKKHRIRTLVGDRVTVEMTPYDLEKGRITYRHKDEPAPSTRGQQRRNFRRR